MTPSTSRFIGLGLFVLAGCASEPADDADPTSSDAISSRRVELVAGFERMSTTPATSTKSRIEATVHFGNAHLLATLSNLAYLQPPEFAAGVSALGLDGRSIVAIANRCTGGFAYYVKQDRFVAVVFRGSENGRDWAANADTTLVPWSDDARVHRGFAGQFESLWARQSACGVEMGLRAVFQSRFAPEGRDVYLTGHSLGGALATLATARLLDEGTVPVTALYAFGAPRTGDAGFGDRLTTRAHDKTALFLFVFGADIVTAVPEASATEPYFHFARAGEDEAGHEISMTADNVSFGSRTPYADRWSIADHDILRYIAAAKREASVRARRSGP